jgi:hypothetical protein
MAIALRKMISRLTMGTKYYDGEDDFEIGNLSGKHEIESNSPQLYNRQNLKCFILVRKKLFKHNLAGISLSFIFDLWSHLPVYSTCFTSSMAKLNVENDLISNIPTEFKTLLPLLAH